jgi:hypothetical protein
MNRRPNNRPRAILRHLDSGTASSFDPSVICMVGGFRRPTWCQPAKTRHRRRAHSSKSEYGAAPRWMCGRVNIHSPATEWRRLSTATGRWCWDRLFFPVRLSLSKGAFVLRRCNGNCPRIAWILYGFLGFPVRSPEMDRALRQASGRTEDCASQRPGGLSGKAGNTDTGARSTLRKQREPGASGRE